MSKFFPWRKQAEKIQERTMALLPPAKVFIERIDDNFETFEYSEQVPALLDRGLSLSSLGGYDALFSGFYAAQNYLNLFYCLPEIFAPIHEIASRVADAQWELVKDFKGKDREDEVDYSNETFNALFTQPNPFQDHKTLVYWSVVYEILCGKQFWYFNKPELLPDEWTSIKSWFNLPAPAVTINMKQRYDPWSATEVEDLVTNYSMPNGFGGQRLFETSNVASVLYPDAANPFKDLNRCVPIIAGAEKPIRNLIPVYEARGVIYIKRGELGFIVNKSKDQSGTIPLKQDEKDEINKERYRKHGLGAHQTPIGFTSANVDFVRTSMSIQELQPFEETLADAIAIYKVLRVPTHLAPNPKNSTFDNADQDMKIFYNDVIIPLAQKYALIWTNKMKLKDFRRFIRPSFKHIGFLQENEKEKADRDKVNGTTWLERWKNGACTLNDWIASFDGIPGSGAIYEKKIFELTPEEAQAARDIMYGKQDKNETPAPKNS